MGHVRFYINMYARTWSGNVPYPVLSNTDKRKKMADHEVVYVELFNDFEKLTMCVCSFGCNSVTVLIFNTGITLLGREKVEGMSIYNLHRKILVILSVYID